MVQPTARKPLKPVLRPSPEIGLAVVSALALPRPAFARSVTGRGAPSLELGAALRVRRIANGGLAIQARVTLESPWRDAPELDELEVLDTRALAEQALNCAARAHLAHAIELCGLEDHPFAPEERLYAERRLRADLFPPATTPQTARHIRALLLTEILEPHARRTVFLIHGHRARYRDFKEAALAGMATLSLLTDETPNLAPLLAPLTRAHARKHTEAIAHGAIGALRATLLTASPAERLAPRDWKWLARQPNGVVRRLCAASETGALDSLAVRLFAATSETRIPHAILDLDTAGGPLNRALLTLKRNGVPQPHFEDLARLMRLLIREARERMRRRQSLRFLRDDAGYVIDWWLEEMTHGRGLIEPNATYASLIRRQQRWHQLMILKSPEHMLAWSSELPAYESAGLRVVPLTDSLMLAREGMEMRHCVASYARDCMRGDTRIFALEDVDSGERATLEIRRRAWVWFAGQIKGPCNAEVSSRMRAAADRLAGRYTQTAQRNTH